MSSDLASSGIDLRKYVIPVSDAISELQLRQQDQKLRKAVEVYLDGDIPEYFKKSPILYLARHIASPNFETLRFLELCKPYGLPMVIGQDTKDIFTPRNTLKKPLCKMPVVRGVTNSSREIIENFTIIDFNTAQGKPLHSITTIFGEPLTQFHSELLKTINIANLTIVDDAEWIDRNHRGNLLEHYKKFLSLFIVHGVMFEFFTADEQKFIEDIFEPAFEFVELKFGVKPLIAELVTPELVKIRDWSTFPNSIHKIVTDKFGQLPPQE